MKYDLVIEWKFLFVHQNLGERDGGGKILSTEREGKTGKKERKS